VYLELVLTNVEETVTEVKIRGSLGCSDYALFEFVISRNVCLAKKWSQDPELQESKLQAV